MTDFHIIFSPEAGLESSSILHYASLAGLRCVAVVLVSDGSDFDRVASLAAQIRRCSLYAGVEAFAGVELRHVPPALLPDAVKEARTAGGRLVLVHGETICDQVEQGTNFAAIEAGADILAHPGLIDAESAAFAAEKGVALEFTSCPRHAFTNAHTAAMARRFGCLLVRGSCARRPEEISTRSFWLSVVRGADVFESGENKDNLLELLKKSEEVLFRKLMRS